jgi:ATP-dependent RNA helicase RhlB
MSDQHLTEARFSDFDLPEQLMEGITESGFEFCTPIQAQTIPLLLEGKDIAGQAQTGTGKTAAFLVATFTRLLRNQPAADRKPQQPRAFMLAPTRELAIQIHNDAKLLNKTCGFKLGIAYGGIDYEKQRRQFDNGIDILIGTPGRLIDYLKQGVFDLRAVEVLVLDEADRMFDLGFIKDLRFLLNRCSKPEKRLSMLFSATLSFRVLELAYMHMNDAQKIEVQAEQVTADRVEQSVFYTANTDKIPLLLGLLKSENPDRSIVFTNTKKAAETIVAWLEGNDYKVAMLSGDVPQNKRQKLLEQFGTGELNILVATDVAARGLHIPNVTHVFNFDLPQIAADYVHRIGRTARAGASGKALGFACEDTSFYLPDIEEYLEQKLPVLDVQEFIATDFKSAAKIKRYGNSGRSGKPSGGHQKRQGGRKFSGNRNQNRNRSN